MKTLIAALVLGAFAMVALAHQSNSELHYAYRHEASGESEHMSVNWKGTVIWNSHPTTDVIWVQDKGKVYRITDKATLDAMQAATVPLRRSAVTAKSGTKEYQDQREKERNAVYAKTNKIVADAMAKGLGTPINP